MSWLKEKAEEVLNNTVEATASPEQKKIRELAIKLEMEEIGQKNLPDTIDPFWVQAPFIAQTNYNFKIHTFQYLYMSPDKRYFLAKEDDIVLFIDTDPEKDPFFNTQIEENQNEIRFLEQPFHVWNEEKYTWSKIIHIKTERNNQVTEKFIAWQQM